MSAKRGAPVGKLISQNEAADRVGVSRRTIERYIADDKLPAYRVGDRLVKLREADVDALAKRIEKKKHDET